jgi:hypothetical protein
VGDSSEDEKEIFRLEGVLVNGHHRAAWRQILHSIGQKSSDTSMLLSSKDALGQRSCGICWEILRRRIGNATASAKTRFSAEHEITLISGVLELASQQPWYCSRLAI